MQGLVYLHEGNWPSEWARVWLVCVQVLEPWEPQGKTRPEGATSGTSQTMPPACLLVHPGLFP